MDRHGIKRFVLLAVVFTAGGSLVYALAHDWRYLVAAAVLASIAGSLSNTGCRVICADSVESKDRVTAQNVCSTLASVIGMISPLVGAYLVTVFGGITVEGIRPLYYLQFAGYSLILLLIIAQLREPKREQLAGAETGFGFIVDFRHLFKGRGDLPRWIAISALTTLPMALFWPFVQLYAHEIKGADQYLLGVMASATVVTQLVFGIPVGRLADKIGRKRVIYSLTPLWYASNLFLAFSPGPIGLVLSAALLAFYSISAGATSAMTLELLPLEQQGRWGGLIGLFTGLVTIPAPIIGGFIWRELGPMYVFIIPIVFDLFSRVPLLTTVPETLGTEHPIQKES
jgi:MFS family permease